MTRALALLLVALALPAAASAQTTTSDRTLSVVGTGEAELTPDRGSFSAGVTRRARTAEVARSRAARRANAIVAGQLAIGVPRERIATESISVSRRRKHRTYQASASLNVRVDGLDLLGRAIDAAVRRGATDVYGPDLSFTPALRAQGLRDAEAAALVDARTRAEAAAAAEGQRITGIKSIDLDPSSEEFDEFSADSGAGSSGARTPILAGRQTFTSVARVTYLIEPAG